MCTVRAYSGGNESRVHHCRNRAFAIGARDVNERKVRSG
jgi:hypothetical protein